MNITKTEAIAIVRKSPVLLLDSPIEELHNIAILYLNVSRQIAAHRLSVAQYSEVTERLTNTLVSKVETAVCFND